MILSALFLLAALIGIQAILVVRLADRLTPAADGRDAAPRAAAPAHGRYASLA
ncbi:hypothetical protein [Methylobacterium sp. JK268]